MLAFCVFYGYIGGGKTWKIVTKCYDKKSGFYGVKGLIRVSSKGDISDEKDIVISVIDNVHKYDGMCR